MPQQPKKQWGKTFRCCCRQRPWSPSASTAGTAPLPPGATLVWGGEEGGFTP